MKNKSSKVIKEVILSNFDRKIMIIDMSGNTQTELYDYNKDYNDLDFDLQCVCDEDGKTLNPVYESIFKNYPTINLSLLSEYFEKVKKDNPQIDPTEIVLTYKPSCYVSEANYRISHFREETDQEYKERVSFYEMKRLQKEKEKEAKRIKSAENKKALYQKLKIEFGD